MKIEKAECNYQVTECDLKFGEQIVLDGELLIPVSVLDKIRAEIEQLPTTKCTETRKIYINADAFKENVFAILDKYKAESEE